MNEQQFAELAAGHALGALNADDERAFEATLAAHPEWTPLVDSDAEVVSRLALTIPDAAPPPELKERIFAHLGDQTGGTPAAPGTPHEAHGTAAEAPPLAGEARFTRREARSARPGSDPAPEPPRANRRARMWFALAASLALVLGVGAGATVLVQTITRPASVIALERIEDAPDAQRVEAEIADGGDATLHWSESLGEAVLVSEGLPTITDAQTFELWYLEGETPTSAGTFDAASGTTTTLLGPGIQSADAVAVSVERSGGSPVGAPTTTPLVIISTA